LCCGLSGPVLFSADKAQPTSFSAVLEGKETDIVEAVEDVVKDTVIHGTFVYDKEKTFGGAEDEKSSKAFAQWTGGGKVYYKVAHDALAPRNFKGSEDQGTITAAWHKRNSTVIEPVPGDWQVMSSNHAYEKIEAHTLKYQIAVPRESTAKLVYRVRLRF